MGIVSLEEAYREAIASAPHAITIIDTITLTHSLLPGPIRFASSEKDVTLGGDLYVGRQFQIKLPVMKAKTTSGIELSLTDINFEVGNFLDEIAETLETLKVLYQAFLSTEPTAQAEFKAPLAATIVTMKDRTLSITATYPDLVNKKIPAISQTTNIFPGLR